MIRKICVLFAIMLTTVCIFASCGEYNEDGLKFDLLENGTYEVSVGRAKDSTEIIIPSTYNGKPVTKIADSGFEFVTDPNYSIEKIVIPESVTAIGKDAFYNCKGLINISIPDSVNELGDGAFFWCDSLNLNEHDNAYYIGSESNPYLILYKAKSKNISSCIIHFDTRFIHDQAFYRCGSLKEVNIPDKVYKIGQAAFYECGSIKDLDLGESVKIIESYAFYDCFAISAIKIPDTTETIGIETFKYCRGISTISFGSGVKSVGPDAFEDCKKVLAVRIEDLSAWCKIKFTNHSSNPLCNKSDLYYEGSPITKLKIPYDITSIGDYVFYNCTTLSYVNIPSNITSIGTDAFAGCSDIVQVNVESLDDWAGINFASYNSNPLYYSEKLYLDNELVTELQLSDAAKIITNYAFYCCKSLKSVKIPDSVESIGESAFDCCTSIEKVSIGNGVTTIGIGAFHRCSKLTDIIIGSGVKSVDESAFENCNSLYNVFFRGSAKQWDKIKFGKNNNRLLNSSKRYNYSGE